MWSGSLVGSATRFSGYLRNIGGGCVSTDSQYSFHRFEHSNSSEFSSVWEEKFAWNKENIARNWRVMRWARCRIVREWPVSGCVVWFVCDVFDSHAQSCDF